MEVRKINKREKEDTDGTDKIQNTINIDSKCPVNCLLQVMRIKKKD